MKFLKVFSFILLGPILLSLTSCIANQVEISPTEPVVLVRPLALAELLQIDDKMELYEKNLFIGDIRYSGGVVNDPAEGMRVRTRNIELEPYRYFENIDSALFQIITEVLSEKGMAYVIKELQGPYKPDLDIVEDLVPSKDEGHDNINLPIWLYRPGPIDTKFLRNNGIYEGILVVPLIEHAYSHMGGWFYNQWSGTYAGVRMTFHLVLIDAATGAVRHVDTKTFKFVSNKGILSDFFIKRHINQLLDEYQEYLDKVIKLN